MADSPFRLPETSASASLSQVPSTVSDDSSQPTSSRGHPKLIWVYFRDSKGNEPSTFLIASKKGHKMKKQLHYCLLCEEGNQPTIWSTSFTHNAKNHVMKHHPDAWIRWNRENNALGPFIRQSSQKTLDGFVQPILPQQSESIILRSAYDRSRHIQAMIALCSRRRLVLSATEWPELHELMLSANPLISDLIKLSRRQLVTLLAKNHHQYRIQLQSSLQDAQSKIHISTDMWTSPARRGHLAVCAQWVDHEYKLQKALLSLPQVQGSHSGIAQAQHTLQILDDYGIATRFGYHTGDNATSNDTMMEYLVEQLQLKYGVCLTIIYIDL
jgi:hypothetical protein